jgi:hypothetical protein
VFACTNYRLDLLIFIIVRIMRTNPRNNKRICIIIHYIVDVNSQHRTPHRSTNDNITITNKNNMNNSSLELQLSTREDSMSLSRL